MIDFMITMSKNITRDATENTYSEKPDDKLDLKTISVPPPHHPRLIRSGGGVIPDIIAPAMSGSILINPRTCIGLPQ